MSPSPFESTALLSAKNFTPSGAALASSDGYSKYANTPAATDAEEALCDQRVT